MAIQAELVRIYAEVEAEYSNKEGVETEVLKEEENGTNTCLLG